MVMAVRCAAVMRGGRKPLVVLLRSSRAVAAGVSVPMARAPPENTTSLPVSVMGEAPAAPVAPVAPVDPATPAAPVSPFAPAAPSAPAGPTRLTPVGQAPATLGPKRVLVVVLR